MKGTVMKIQLGACFLLLTLGGAVLGGCPGPTPQSLCDKLEARERRCNPDAGLQPCQIEDQRNACVSLAGTFRSDFLAAMNACQIEEAPCGNEGEATLTQCQSDAYRRLTITTAYRDMVNAMCERCPSILNDTDTASCVNTFTQLPADDRAPTFGILGSLIARNDSLFQGVTTCANAVMQSSPDACGAIRECMRPLSPFSASPPPSTCPADGGM
jgi:hypothetical protein